MDEKDLQSMTLLANKLGCGPESIFSALMREAQIAGAVDLIATVAWVICTIIWARHVKNMTARPCLTENHRYPHPQWESPCTIFAAWGSVVASTLLAALKVLVFTHTNLSGLINPEFWALQHIHLHP